jgi:phage head maturation protease
MNRDELLIAPGRPGAQTVKALQGAKADGRIGGYLIAWGSAERPDLQGEYFTPATDLLLDSFPIAASMVLYHHGLDRTVGVKRVGTIDTVRVDDVGVWAEAQLEMRDAYERKIYELAARGKLGWSSGALPQSVRVNKHTGEILQWGVVEGSLTPVPAQPYDTSIMPIKALAMPAHTLTQEVKMDPIAMVQAVAQALGLTLTDEQLASAVAAVQGEVPNAESGDAMQAALGDVQKTEALVQSVAKAVLSTINARDTFAKAASKFADSLTPESRAGSRTQEQQPRARDMKDRRFADLKAEDMIFGATILSEARRPASLDFLKATFEKLERLLPYDNNAYGRDYEAIKAAMPLKADEVVATNLSGNGGNWVGQAYATQLWEVARQPVVYQELLKAGLNEITVPQGMSTIYIPTEGTDPVWYTMPEQNDMTTDEFMPISAKATPTIAPGRRQLTPTPVGARVMFSDIMAEDSLIPVLPTLRSRMDVSAQEAIEFMLLNGDTATGANTNLNLIDGTPSVDSKGRGPRYLAFDGLLKLPIITTTAQSRDGGTLTEDDYLATYNLLPTNEVDESKLVFLVDVRTYVATRNLPAFKTRDVSSYATLEGGQIAGVYGVRLLKSNQMGLANTAGRISGTPSNNTRGRILVVRPDRWYLGRKRDVTTEVARDIDAMATVIVSSLRIGLQSFAATGCAAASYNLTV